MSMKVHAIGIILDYIHLSIALPPTSHCRTVVTKRIFKRRVRCADGKKRTPPLAGSWGFPGLRVAAEGVCRAKSLETLWQFHFKLKMGLQQPQIARKSEIQKTRTSGKSIGAFLAGALFREPENSEGYQNLASGTSECFALAWLSLASALPGSLISGLFWSS